MGTLQKEFENIANNLPIKDAWKKALQQHPLKDDDFSQAICRVLLMQTGEPKLQSTLGDPLRNLMNECYRKLFENNSKEEAINILKKDLRELFNILNDKDKKQSQQFKSNR